MLKVQTMTWINVIFSFDHFLLNNTYKATLQGTLDDDECHSR